jgi:hypothetical protein
MFQLDALLASTAAEAASSLYHSRPPAGAAVSDPLGESLQSGAETVLLVVNDRIRERDGACHGWHDSVCECR